MHNSSSTNSLTGLKESTSTTSLSGLITETIDENNCFICLTVDNELGEPLVQSSMLRRCGCKFYVHPYCWNMWMKGKSDNDCPICHKKSYESVSGPPTPTLVFIAQNPQEPEQNVGSQRRFCCLCFLVFVGAVSLFTIYFLYAK